MKNITFVENIVMMNFPGQKVLSTLHNKIYSGHQETLENIQWSPGNIRKYTVVTRKHWKKYRLLSSFVFKNVTRILKFSKHCAVKFSK